jgi:hypothetical protein
MVKHKTAQELMAVRNPLMRTPVTPVDIYSQPPKPVEESEREQEPTTTEARPTQTKSSEVPLHKKTGNRVRPYSTYLYQSQVKGIKLRAIDREIDDKDVVQEAIDEYFKKHPL